MDVLLSLGKYLGNFSHKNINQLISIKNLVPLARTKSKELDQLKSWSESGNVISASKYK